MFQFPRRSAAFGWLPAIALLLGAPALVEAATVTPHVFEGGITLVDLADEHLDPWGFYEGTKGLPVPAIASGSDIARPAPGQGPGKWIAAAGWSDSTGGGGEADAPLFAPLPASAGPFERRSPSPCFWGDDRFGSVGSRNRCGHPAAQPQDPGGSPRFAAMPTPLIVLPGWSGRDPVGDPQTPPAPVPLPASAWLLGAALLSLVRMRRR